jgi:hypothetical protein
MDDYGIDNQNVFCFIKRAHAGAHQHLGKIHIREWVLEKSRDGRSKDVVIRPGDKRRNGFESSLELARSKK